MFKWYRWKIGRKLIKFGAWNIAIRQCDNDYLYNNDDSKRVYLNIPNTDTHWFADPILYEENGKTWLFVEAFNNSKHRGEIGVFEIVDGKAKDFRIIIENSFHMSFPYVFEIDGKKYMVPETGDNNSVTLYQSNNFPYEWKKVKDILIGDKYRDSTVYCCGGKIYLYTYLRTDNRRIFHTYKCMLYELNKDDFSLKLIEEYPDSKVNRRSAGPVIYLNDKCIHTTQLCKKCYGEALEFWENSISEISWKHLKPYKKVYGSNVEILNKCIPEIIHTYSATTKYEVIDYKNRENK